MSWKQIIEQWNKQDFSDLILKYTLSGITNNPDKRSIKSHWENYLNWIKSEFPSQDVSQQIDSLWTNNTSNQITIDGFIQNQKWDDIGFEFIYTYLANDDLLNAVKASVSSELDSEYNNAKNNILFQTFPNVGQQSYNQLKKDIKDGERVDEIIFLFVIFKKLFLNNLPQVISQILNEEPPILLSDLNSAKKQNIENLLTDFAKDEDIGVESIYQINRTKVKLLTISIELAEGIQELKTQKAIEKQTSSSATSDPKYKELENKYDKLKEFARWETGTIKELVKTIYALQQSQVSSPSTSTGTSSSTTGTTTPDTSTTMPDISKPPTPVPTPKPDQTTQPDKPGKTPEELATEQLQTLKNEIGQIPLNTIEKQNLANAKNTQEAEAVRTQYNQRIQDEKNEVAKYDKLLNDIQAETDTNNITLLETNGKYNLDINNLIALLLPPNKQPSSLQTIRQEKLATLTKQKNVDIATDLLDQINNWEDITTLPSTDNIKSKYDEGLVSVDLKYDKLIEARNAIRLKLFKSRFEKPTKTGLSDIDIDKWRDSAKTTGLSGIGTEEREAFLNGWKIEEIKNRKIAIYQITTQTTEKVENIDPLQVNKEKLDTALKVLADINDPNKTTFKSLPKNYRKTEINALPADLPGNANPTYLTQKIKDRRETFVLSLNKLEDDAFDQEKYDSILLKIKEKYPANEYKPFTAEIANKVLKYNVKKENEYIGKGKDQKLKPIKDLTPSINEDLDEWLTHPDQKGYRIENEPEQMIKGEMMTGAKALAQEEEWIKNNERGKQGKLLLPFFCAKVKYDPNQPEKFFCEAGDTIKGHLPFATGIGKTTKVVHCLEFYMELADNLWKPTGNKRNVVLVLPTQVLASSAANHHNSWLQEYKCPIHDIKHGEYKVNKDEIGEGLSIIYYPYLTGYVAREFVKWKGKEGGKPFDLTKIADIQDKIQIVKEGTKLNALDPILVFDEAHFADPQYKALMEGCITKGFKCLKMSATFPGVPWSITTSYPLVTRKVDGFTDDMIKPEDKTAVFIRNKLNDEQKKILNDAGVCWVELDASMAPAAEGITIGMPKGTTFFMTWIYEMGVSMDIKNVIITNWIETNKLGDMGKGGKGFWFYSDPIPQKCPIASLGQQRGRVSRLYPGNCYVLVDKDGKLEYEEVKPTDDVGTIFTQAVFSGDTSNIKYSMFQKSLNLTLASLAWPDKFGLKPEEILIGVQQGGIPPNIFPKFDIKQPSQGCDEGLWNRYMKIEVPNEMPKEQAQDILSNMIGNLLVSPGKLNDFPNKVLVEINSPLINRIDWLASKKQVKPKKEGDPVKWVAQDNSKSIAECQKMINGTIEKLLSKLPDYAPDKVAYKNEETFKKLVDIYKCMDGLKITIEQDFTDDWIDKKKPDLGKRPKDSLTLRLMYNATSGRSFFIK